MTCQPWWRNGITDGKGYTDHAGTTPCGISPGKTNDEAISLSPADQANVDMQSH